MDKHVANLKAALPPEHVEKLDAMGFDWTKFLQNLPALIALLTSLFGTPVVPAPRT